LPRIFLGHPGSGQLPQLVVDQGQKLFGGLAIAALNLAEDLRDVADGAASGRGGYANSA
jgi:hypothetical protein